MARSGRCSWLASVCVALLGAVLPTCGGSESCIQVECISGAWLHIPLASPAAGLVGATITVHRNSELYAAPLPEVPSADSAGASVVFSGTTDVVGTLWQRPDQTVVLDIEWHVGSASQTVDGDHYIVTLTDATAVTTTLLDKTAIYQPTTADPRQCAPATTCSIAELTP